MNLAKMIVIFIVNFPFTTTQLSPCTHHQRASGRKMRFSLKQPFRTRPRGWVIQNFSILKIIFKDTYPKGKGHDCRAVMPLFIFGVRSSPFRDKTTLKMRKRGATATSGKSTPQRVSPPHRHKTHAKNPVTRKGASSAGFACARSSVSAHQDSVTRRHR